jgi:peptidyl-dipeptidase Dcp
MREELFKFSSEDLRPYFPLESVLNGVFNHFSRLFGLKFTKSDKYAVWHKDVTAYDVTEDSSGRFIGTFFADFFPRKGKKSGAWKTSFRDQGLYGGNVERPIIAIVCNFTKPTKDAPSLLTFDEVSTLFHEMGHAVHGLLSDVTYTSLAGTNVLWDFVELPSQVQENWAYEKETLDLFAAHYQTGAKIPADLIDRLNESKNYMVAWGGLRQVAFAQLDMLWHTADPASIKDVESFEDKAVADAILFPRLAGPFSLSFGHLFGGGYAAGYYSYKWAEVLDADTFELFLERGLYDRATADAYKAEILSKGGSAHPSVLYRRFRGRDADPDALLRREGLLAA